MSPLLVTRCPQWLQHVGEHGTPQLGIEPGALGGHDAALIGNIHQRCGQNVATPVVEP